MAASKSSPRRPASAALRWTLTFFVVLLTGCPADPPGDGLLVVRVRVLEEPTQAISNVDELNFDLSRVDIVHRTVASDASSERVITVDREARSFALALDKGNVVEVAYLPSPPGSVMQVRFVAYGVTSRVAGAVQDVKLPSGEQTGLKLVPIDDEPFTVVAKERTTIEAEFDPNRRIVLNRGQGLILKPTVPTQLVPEPASRRVAGRLMRNVVGTDQKTASGGRVNMHRTVTNAVKSPKSDDCPL